MQSSTSRPSRIGSALAPAPWGLRADAYVFAIKLPHGSGRAELFVTDELAEARFGPLGWVMYVDYSEAPVGPYRELLLIPGSFRFGKRRLPSITKIYVSSQASVDNGRRNWGIPKERASFETEREGERVEHVRVRVGGALAIELTLRHGTLALPVSAAILPSRLRTLGQTLDGRSYEVTPSARGLMQRAKVEHAWSDPSLFVGMSAKSVVSAVRLSKVNLTFPAAHVR
jgi:hypothetical protein